MRVSGRTLIAFYGPFFSKKNAANYYWLLHDTIPVASFFHCIFFIRDSIDFFFRGCAREMMTMGGWEVWRLYCIQVGCV